MICAVPKSTPRIAGCTLGVVAPAGTVTVGVVIVTFEGSLEVTVTVRPPLGAGVDRTTPKSLDAPGARAIPLGTAIAFGPSTATVIVISCTQGNALARSVVTPGFSPRTTI